MGNDQILDKKKGSKETLFVETRIKQEMAREANTGGMEEDWEHFAVTGCTGKGGGRTVIPGVHGGNKGWGGKREGKGGINSLPGDEPTSLREGKNQAVGKGEKKKNQGGVAGSGGQGSKEDGGIIPSGGVLLVDVQNTKKKKGSNKRRTINPQKLLEKKPDWVGEGGSVKLGGIT